MSILALSIFSDLLRCISHAISLSCEFLIVFSSRTNGDTVLSHVSIWLTTLLSLKNIYHARVRLESNAIVMSIFFLDILYFG